MSLFVVLWTFTLEVRLNSQYVAQRYFRKEVLFSNRIWAGVYIIWPPPFSAGWKWQRQLQVNFASSSRALSSVNPARILLEGGRYCWFLLRIPIFYFAGTALTISLLCLIATFLLDYLYLLKCFWREHSIYCKYWQFWNFIARLSSTFGALSSRRREYSWQYFVHTHTLETEVHHYILCCNPRLQMQT